MTISFTNDWINEDVSPNSSFIYTENCIEGLCDCVELLPLKRKLIICFEYVYFKKWKSLLWWHERKYDSQDWEHDKTGTSNTSAIVFPEKCKNN